MSLAGLVGAGATVGFAFSPAEATTLGQLKKLETAPAGPADDLAEALGQAPDGTPVDQVQWGPPGPPPGRRPPGPPPSYRRPRRRRRRVCGWRRDRRGRRFRDCWYVRR